MSLFDKGIPTSDGFSLGSPLPLDMRLIKQNRAELEAMPAGICYDEMRVWVKDLQAFYRWDAASQSWKPAISQDAPTIIHSMEYDLKMTSTVLDINIAGMTLETMVDISLIYSDPTNAEKRKEEYDKYNNLLCVDSYDGRITITAKAAVTGIKIRIQWYVPSE